MKQQKVFFETNIRLLRERKKISQEGLSKALGITRAKLAALEYGNTKSPQTFDYVNFSNYFKISIDTLIKVDLRKLTEFKIQQLEGGNDVYMMGGNIRVLAITVDKKNKENVEYVPIKAKAGYSSGGYIDPEFIAKLPRFSIPNLPDGSFRIFPIVGDSMLPIAEGSDIVAEYLEDWKSIKAQTLCIVILKGEQDFVFKQVTLISEGNFLLESLNKAYESYLVTAENVLEIWKFKKYLTSTLPEEITDIQHVLSMVKELKEDIKKLKN